MSYSKTIWENDITPLNATNLNNIEEGIVGVENQIINFLNEAYINKYNNSTALVDYWYYPEEENSWGVTGLQSAQGYTVTDYIAVHPNHILIAHDQSIREGKRSGLLRSGSIVFDKNKQYLGTTEKIGNMNDFALFYRNTSSELQYIRFNLNNDFINLMIEEKKYQEKPIFSPIFFPFVSIQQLLENFLDTDRYGLFLKPKSYFNDEIISTTKTILEKIQTGPALVLTWLTDIHDSLNEEPFNRHTKDTCTNIRAVNNLIPSHSIVATGDWVLGDQADYTQDDANRIISRLRGYLMASNDKVYMVPGNHDGPGGSVPKDSNYGCALMQSDEYTVRDDDAPWYYVDYPHVNVRVLFLATNAYEDGATVWGVSDKQLAWIKATLTSVPQDWSVMVFSHIGTFDQLTYNGIMQGFNVNREETAAILNDFHNHTGEYTNATGRVIGWFCGHEHLDWIVPKANSLCDFPVVVTTASGMFRYTNPPSDWAGAYSPERADCTVSQDAWDTIIYKPTEGKLYTVRFGAGEDREIDVDGLPEFVDAPAAAERLDQLSRLVDRKVDAIPTKNLFNKNASDVLSGSFIDSYGSIITNIQPIYFASGMITVDGDTQYTISPAATGGASYACYDRYGAYIDIGGYPQLTDIAAAGGTITTPPGAKYLRFSGRLEYIDVTQLEAGSSATEFEPYNQFKPIVDAENRISALENTDVLEDITYANELNPEETTDGYYLNETGNAIMNATLCYTDYIRIVDNLYAFYRDLKPAYLRFASYYDKNKVFLQTVSFPNGVGGVDRACYVRLTVRLSEKNDIMVTRNANPHEWLDYGEARILESLLPADADVKNGVLQIETASLVGGETLTLGANLDVKKNNTIAFTCKIDTFSSLRIGHGTTQYSSGYVVIDSTNIRSCTYLRSEQVDKTEAHDLTISGFLSVVVQANVSDAKITIFTASGMYSMTTPWAGCNGEIYAESIDSKLTDCKLSFTCADLRCPTWVFGDSYLGLTSPARYPYYVLEMGYSNWLACSYPGSGTAAQVACFSKLLAMGKPQIAVLTTGMNDPDGGSINESWLSNVQTFVDLCLNNGIAPVLATIPSVWGSASEDSDITLVRDNSHKNTWVRESGYRFVDFERAVGADIGNGWYDGMLSDDGVHPTSLGAQALAARLVVDVPEIAV